MAVSISQEPGPDGILRWRIRYQDGGKRRSKTFGNEFEAKAFAADQRAAAARLKSTPDGLPPAPAEGDDSRSGWLAHLTYARDRVSSSIATGQADALQAARVIAALGSSAAKFVDAADLEKRLTHLETQRADEEDRDRHAVGTDEPDEAAREKLGSGAPVFDVRHPADSLLPH